jgi:hypothetical protein
VADKRDSNMPKSKNRRRAGRLKGTVVPKHWRSVSRREQLTEDAAQRFHHLYAAPFHAAWPGVWIATSGGLLLGTRGSKFWNVSGDFLVADDEVEVLSLAGAAFDHQGVR